ncbi:MAG: winged helix family transcriptional regulator [Nitrospiraceae bacterium]|nr:MAG: winged helix family transcriptional regulator [Nitrospiraceae bacterium]
MDLDRHEVPINGHAVDLTHKEFQILQHFLESPRRVFSRQEMLSTGCGGKARRSKSTRLMCTFIRCGRRRQGRGLQAVGLRSAGICPRNYEYLMIQIPYVSGIVSVIRSHYSGWALIITTGIKVTN